MTYDEEEAKQKFNKAIHTLSDQIDKSLNGPGVTPANRQIGMILLVFPLKIPGGCTIASNGVDQRDVVTILGQQAGLLEDQLKLN